MKEQRGKKERETVKSTTARYHQQRGARGARPCNNSKRETVLSVVLQFPPDCFISFEILDGMRNCKVEPSQNFLEVAYLKSQLVWMEEKGGGGLLLLVYPQ